MGFNEKSIPAIFHNRAAKYRYEPFLRYKKDGSYKEMSWTDAQKRVRALGLGIVSLGIKPGDMVAIFAENSWEWIIADLAIMSIGAVDVPVYATNSGEEAAYILNDSKAKALFVSDRDHLDRILPLRSRLKDLRNIITFDELESGEKFITSLDKLLEVGDNAKDKDGSTFEKMIESIDPEGIATLIYTSGTTGPPKGVMLTHNNFVSNVMQCYATHPMVGHSDSSLLILPLSHSFGRTVGLYLMIHIGALINLAESFSTVLQNLIETRPTLIASVPRLFEKAYSGILSQVDSSPQFRKKIFSWSAEVASRAVDYKVHNKKMPILLDMQYNMADRLVFSKIRSAMGLDRIKVAINGGGPLSVDIDRFFNGIGIPLHNGYGLTETTPVTNTNTFKVFEFGSVGPAVPDTMIKIAEDGEILVKGPQVMKGYYNQPEATKSVFTEDGWFMTGDIGFIDEKACLHISDRKKDIIITAGGKNISPQNIENALIADQYIEQAVVIGEGKKFLSALVVPNFADLKEYAKKRGLSFTTDEELVKKPEIIEFYDERIKSIMKDFARVEQIRKFTLLAKEFTQQAGELTPTLKLKRKVINEKYADVIDSMYKE